MGLLEDLRNAAGDEAGGEDRAYAPAWRPENAGDGLEGVVVSVDRRSHDNHPDGYPIITVRTANGEDYSIHGMSFVLKEELTKRGLRPGDELAVIYDGKKTSNSGRQFHSYRVASRQGSAPAPAPRMREAPAAFADDNPPF